MDSRRMSLEQLNVPEPCRMPWDEMAGGERARFCTHCRKSVYNLSAVPRDEAERLVCEAAGSLCVRFERDAAGAVVTLDYDRTARRRHGWRFWALVGTIGAALAGTANALIPGRPKVSVAAQGRMCVVGELPPMPLTRPVRQPAANAAGTSAQPASWSDLLPDEE